MQSTVTKISTTTAFIPIPPALSQCLWIGVIGSVLFMLIVLIEGTVRNDYDPRQQSVSALSLGPRGWIQTINFFIFGIIIISTASAWRKMLTGGKGATAFPLLMLLTGCSVITCGIFSQDPAPGYDPERLALIKPSWQGLVHLLFAAIGALCSIAGLLVMANRFAKTPLWHGWGFYSVFMALLMTSCVAIYAIGSTNSTGYAGLFERIGLMIVPIWSLSLLVRLGKGVPFMKEMSAPSTHD
jgi:hypothetical protein